MAFFLQDVLNSFYSRIQEGVPLNALDVTTSRITIPNFIVQLTSVVRSINDFSPFVQHAIISVTLGKQYYQLPSDFITETGVTYRSTRLRRAVSRDPYFMTSTNNSFPYQYDVLWPGTPASALIVTGNPYIIIDPPPPETSPAIVPVFPGFNDPFLVIFYRARIPTDFSVANYTTYVFNLPDDVATILEDLVVAKIMALEGKANIYQQTFMEAIDKLKRLQSYVQSIGENNPEQIQDYWWND
jgi:hypothetical protein